MPARRNVDNIIYQKLRLAYEGKFGSSASLLAKAIDDKVNLREEARRGKHVLSERAIHIFFNKADDQNRRFNLTTLNYLAQGLLDLESYDIAVQKATAQEKLSQTVTSSGNSVQARTIEELLATHRQRNLDRYSYVKSPAMFTPLPINDIYVDLNILEREQKRSILRQSLAKEDRSSGLERSDTGFLIIESNLPILEALEKYQYLMLWGRLGAGKTTTLKHMLNHGELHKHGVYLELRKIFTNSESTIKEFILNEFRTKNEEEQSLIEKHLEEGGFSIFFDGLDEVSADVFNSVCKQLEDFVDRYCKNQFVITCRYGVYDYGFRRFTEVEACKLSLPKIEHYVNQWHGIYADSDRASEIIKTIRADEAVRRMASTPLMLNLICLTLESGRGIATNMYALCEDAFMTSIEKWDQHRNINRDVTKMSKLKKIDFLGKIGLNGMNKSEKKVIWKMTELTEQAQEVLKKLPSYNLETIEEDANKEIQVLEGYHSLLKREVNGMYSFDSPIYQYFACANYIVRQDDSGLLKEVVETRLLDRQWKDIFLMIAERRSDAEKFLKYMFWQVSQLSQSKKIQEWLSWIYKTAKDSNVNSNSYRAGILAIDTEINFFLSRYSIDQETRRIAHTLANNLRELNRRHGTIIKSQEPFNIRLDLACLHTLAEDYAFTENISLEKASDFAKSYLSLLKANDFSFIRVLEEQIKISEILGMQDLKTELVLLSERLPAEEKKDQKEEWRTWSERLRALLNKYLDIGHNVSLSVEDGNNLTDYLYATNLLSECLLVDASIEYETRQQIRRNFLLPKEHIHEDLLSPVL